MGSSPQPELDGAWASESARSLSLEPDTQEAWAHHTQTPPGAQLPLCPRDRVLATSHNGIREEGKSGDGEWEGGEECV